MQRLSIANLTFTYGTKVSKYQIWGEDVSFGPNSYLTFEPTGQIDTSSMRVRSVYVLTEALNKIKYSNKNSQAKQDIIYNSASKTGIVYF